MPKSPKQKSKNLNQVLTSIFREGEAYTEKKKIVDGLKDEIVQEIRELKQFPKEISSIVDGFISNRTLEGQYDFLIEVSRYNPDLGGFFWNYFFISTPTEKQAEFLNFIVSSDSHSLFLSIRSLENFLGQAEFSSEVLANWFIAISERVKDDFASGEFFSIFKKWAQSNPKQTIEIIQIYRDKKLSTACIPQYLGSLFLAEMRACEHSDSLEKELEVSEDYFDKLLLLDSWRLYSFLRVIEQEKIKILIAENEKNIELNTALLNFVLEVSLSEKQNSEVKKIAYKYLKKMASSDNEDLAKYNILSTVWRRTKGEKKCLDEIVYKILPLNPENLGTWEKLGDYLIAKIEKQENLVPLLKEILKTNGGTLTKIILGKNKLDYFVQNLQQDTALLENIVLDLLVFNKKDAIILALAVLEKTNHQINSISPNLTESKILNCLHIFQAQFIHLSGLSTSNFLLFLDSAVDKLDKIPERLSNELTQELFDQAMNYGKSCFEEWKKNKTKSTRINKALKLAESYYQGLKDAKKFSANSFSFPGIERAWDTSQEQFNHEVRKSAYENSIARHLCRNFEILYGKDWATVDPLGGMNISAPSALSSFNVESELSRLEFSRPEANALKRFFIRKNIND